MMTAIMTFLVLDLAGRDFDELSRRAYTHYEGGGAATPFRLCRQAVMTPNQIARLSPVENTVSTGLKRAKWR